MVQLLKVEGAIGFKTLKEKFAKMKTTKDTMPIMAPITFLSLKLIAIVLVLKKKSSTNTITNGSVQAFSFVSKAQIAEMIAPAKNKYFDFDSESLAFIYMATDIK